jgi:hypothetical protein
MADRVTHSRIGAKGDRVWRHTTRQELNNLFLPAIPLNVTFLE